MVMVADSVPGLKGFIRPAKLRGTAREMVLRMVIGFIFHRGRMSCLGAAGAVRSETRHRAQVSRFLARPRWRAHDMNRVFREALLEMEAAKGRFLFLVDGTLCGQQGKKTKNTYSTGNRRRRPKKGRRYGKKKHARKTCHSFTMGLLITPSGIRIPFQRPYRTEKYCQEKGHVHRTTAESAADMIRDLPLPEGVEVTVLGDTAYDAQVVREACEDRNYQWIVPCNPERVLAGEKPRPKVRSVLKDWSKKSLKTIRFVPANGKYANYRRLSPYRVGPKAKSRTYYVHQEKRAVHSVGKVQLVFSTTKQKLTKATADDVKILMTNDLRMSVREVIELYSIRWQIELFFKELKSTLGFHQYRFQEFEAVEGWAESALTTVLYLEWYRARQLAKRGLSEEKKRWWRHQRIYGLCQAIRLGTEQNQLKYLEDRLETDGGIRRLKRLIRASYPSEYRAAT
ncbi:MAG TPA: transposase [Phycisphaerae bacterium]|nr:transposase [Phycisphaerae bacterium]